MHADAPAFLKSVKIIDLATSRTKETLKMSENVLSILSAHKVQELEVFSGQLNSFMLEKNKLGSMWSRRTI